MDEDPSIGAPHSGESMKGLVSFSDSSDGNGSIGGANTSAPDVLMTHPVLVLYVEELKATMRGHFAWLGAAVALLAVGGLATVATQDTWLDGYGILAYGFVPLAFIPLAAGFIASARATRFVESVFTAPVERHHWLAAKSLVLLTLAVAYYVALLPMLAVYAHHIALPPLLRSFLMWTPAILLVSVSVGVLVGVLFIGRSIAAPAATGMGILLAYAVAVPLQELLVSQGNGASRTGHLVLLSPVVLLKNALGFTLVAATMPATTTRTWVSLIAIELATVAIAVWVFLRAQGVETWETTRPQRWGLAAALVAITFLPVVLADTNYDRAAPPANQAPPVRGVFGRGSGALALAMPGGNVPGRCCSPVLNRETSALGTDETVRRDLLLLMPVDAAEAVTDVQVKVAGEGGLTVAADTDASGHVNARLERHTYQSDQGPTAVDGHHVVDGWVARVPVTLTPTHPWDIGGDRYPLAVTATYRVGEQAPPRAFNARGAVDAQVSSAIYEMGAAASVFPLICLAAAFGRWRRTR